MDDPDAPFHAHIYYSVEQRPAAERLRDEFIRQTSVAGEHRVLFVGQLTDNGVGPHPLPQY